MTIDQLTEKVIENSKIISAMQEGLKSAHRRIDENDALTARIYELTASIETLTLQLKTQNNQMEKLFESIETRLKAQGERIGELERKSGKKWDAAAEKVYMLVISAVVMFMLAKIGL